MAGDAFLKMGVGWRITPPESLLHARANVTAVGAKKGARARRLTRKGAFFPVTRKKAADNKEKRLSEEPGKADGVAASSLHLPCAALIIVEAHPKAVEHRKVAAWGNSPPGNGKARGGSSMALQPHPFGIIVEEKTGAKMRSFIL